MTTIAQRALVVGGAAVLGVVCAWAGAKTQNRMNQVRRNKENLAKAQACAGK